jgi:hypothetical protein
MNQITQQITSPIRDDKLASLVYNFLLNWQHLENLPRRGRFWRYIYMWQAACDRFSTDDYNRHYDISALPDEPPEMEEQLATLSFAKRRRSFL